MDSLLSFTVSELRSPLCNNDSNPRAKGNVTEVTIAFLLADLTPPVFIQSVTVSLLCYFSKLLALFPNSLHGIYISHRCRLLARIAAHFEMYSLCDFRSGKCLFSIEWLNDGAAAIKASNGKYLMARMNGSLYAVSDDVSEKERFIVKIINKPLLILKCEYGFVGLKAPSLRYECNRTTYDTIVLQPVNNHSAAYHLLGKFSSDNHKMSMCFSDGDGHVIINGSGVS